MTPQEEFRQATWRKSSFSQGSTQCVEVARLGNRVAIRDSKNPAGAILLLTAGGMSELISQIKAGQLQP